MVRIAGPRSVWRPPRGGRRRVALGRRVAAGGVLVAPGLAARRSTGRARRLAAPGLAARGLAGRGQVVEAGGQGVDLRHARLDPRERGAQGVRLAGEAGALASSVSRSATTARRRRGDGPIGMSRFYTASPRQTPRGAVQNLCVSRDFDRYAVHKVVRSATVLRKMQGDSRSVRRRRKSTPSYVDLRSTGRSQSYASPDVPQPFDARGEEHLLLDDLSTLVALGLVEERDRPEGPVYALTELGRHTPEFGLP